MFPLKETGMAKWQNCVIFEALSLIYQTYLKHVTYDMIKFNPLSIEYTFHFPSPDQLGPQRKYEFNSSVVNLKNAYFPIGLDTEQD